MVEKLDGFDMNDDGFDDTEDLERLLFGDNVDESNELVLETNQKIRETPKMSYDQNEMAEKLMQLKPLGLQLSVSPDWMYSRTNPNYARATEAGASQESSDQSKASSDFSLQPMSERLKASNFAATFIKIGSWQRTSRNPCDLVAKCYFAKKKLVWEFLKGGLKSKIEFQWDDIIGINAVMRENQPGILQIELNQPPTFHEEINPQPRKHTIWKLAKDFTGEHASLCRRHYLTFPPGYLDKHYEKLLLSEPRLFELSKQSFPTLKNPFFRSDLYGHPGFASDYNRRVQDFNPGMQFHFPIFPSHLGQTQNMHPYGHIGQTQNMQPYGHIGQTWNMQPYGHVDQAHNMQPYGHIGLSSLQEMPSPLPSPDSWNVLQNQRMVYWGRGMGNYTDASARNQGLVPSVQSTQVHPAVPFQNYNLASLVQEAGMNNYTAKAMSDLEYHLLGDMQDGSNDEKYHMERVESLNQLVNLDEEVNPENKKASQETFYGQDISGEENLVFSIDENANVIGGRFYEQQQFTRLPQIHPVNPPTPQQRNNFPYDPVNNPNPTVDEFGNVNNYNNNRS